jgi:hypothetical protein
VRCILMWAERLGWNDLRWERKLKREYSSAKEAGRLLYGKASLGFEEATSRSRVF